MDGLRYFLVVFFTNQGFINSIGNITICLENNKYPNQKGIAALSGNPGGITITNIIELSYEDFSMFRGDKIDNPK